jgi:hypothetical protein
VPVRRLKAMPNIERLMQLWFDAENRRRQAARLGDREAAMYWTGCKEGIGVAIVEITGEPMHELENKYSYLT